MLRDLRLCALGLIGIVFHTPAEASGKSFSPYGDSTPGSLSLAEARSIAYVRNWDLLAAKANVNLAVAQKIVSHEFPNPTLSLSTQKIGSDAHPAGTTGGNGLWNRNYDTITAVSQLIEIGGKRGIRQASARAGIEAAKASLMDARRLLDLGVGKAYVAVLLAEADERILNETSNSLGKEAEISTDRLKAGDMSESDRAQIEIAAERAELDARTAAANAVAARVVVEVLLGVPHPTGTWKPTDRIEVLAGLNFYSNRVKSTSWRPDLAAALSTLRKAEEDLRLQKAMRVPDPTIFVQYEHQPPDQPNTFGIGLSIPLPFWNSNTGNIKAAEATRDLAALQIGKVRTQIESDIVTARTAQSDALTRWKRYSDQVQPKSAKVLDTITYAYKKGGVPLVSLLQAARTDNEIRLATVQAMSDSATAALTLAAAQNLGFSSLPTDGKNQPHRKSKH